MPEPTVNSVTVTLTEEGICHLTFVFDGDRFARSFPPTQMDLFLREETDRIGELLGITEDDWYQFILSVAKLSPGEFCTVAGSR